MPTKCANETKELLSSNLGWNFSDEIMDVENDTEDLHIRVAVSNEYCAPSGTKTCTHMTCAVISMSCFPC